MSRPVSFWLPMVLLAIAAGFLIPRSESVVVTAQAAQNARTVWDYQTVSVELGSLSLKLNELGKEGWEVLMIIPTDSVVENGTDSKAHLLVQRVEVTAKRAK